MEGSELTMVPLEVDEEVGASSGVTDEVQNRGLDVETQACESIGMDGGDEEVPRWQMNDWQVHKSQSYLSAQVSKKHASSLSVMEVPLGDL